MSRYIHEIKKWPNFYWDEKKIANQLLEVRHRQGRLIGRMEGFGFQFQAEAVLQSLTEEVLKTSEIEGEKLDRGLVRSSLAKRLGMDVAGTAKADRSVEGIVEMMLDATQKFDKPLTQERLYGWHAALFPTGRSGLSKIRVGKWRDDKDGPMQVISGPMGKSKIHYQAPDANLLASEMKKFLAWLNAKQNIDLVLKAAIAHLWFVTIHPFEDGNGRIARAIADMVLAHSEGSAQRFYSMSSQISDEREAYYDILESTQKGTLDITDWLEWFLNCLSRAFAGAEVTLASVLKKKRFWEKHSADNFNARQKKVLNRLLDGFEGNLTSSKWASIANCSQDTASRDIAGLIEMKILSQNSSGGRSTSFSMSD